MFKSLPTTFTGRDARTYCVEPKKSLIDTFHCRFKKVDLTSRDKNNKKVHLEGTGKENAYQFFINLQPNSPNKGDGKLEDNRVFLPVANRHYCIDIDDPTVSISDLPIFMKENGAFTISTSGKIHWIFKCDEDLRDLLGNKCIQIFKQNGDCVNDIDLKDTIYELMEGDVYYCDSQKQMTIPRFKIQGLIFVEKLNNEADKELTPYETDISQWRALMTIAAEENKSFNGWSRMCFIMPEGQEYEQLFFEWSCIGYNAHEHECRSKFQTSEHVGSFGALINTAKVYNSGAVMDFISDVKIDGSRQYIAGGNVGVAKLFYKLCKNSYVYKNETWYELTKIGRWCQLDKKNTGLINAFHDSVSPAICQIYNDVNDAVAELEKSGEKDEQYEATIKAISKLKSDVEKVKFQTDSVRYAAKFFLKPDMKFDANPYLVGFNNGVWDFTEKVRAFRAYQPQDYMTLSVGYDWNEKVVSDQGKNDFLNSLMKQIFHDDDIIKFFKSTMARTLIGINSQKFIIQNGCGGNAKGLLCEGLGSATFGDYSYNMPTHLVTDAKKGGANTELAKCHNKRFIFCKEPSGKKCLDNSSIKELTGGGIINARQCFSNDTDVSLCGTLFMETNPKLNWIEEPSDAEIRRVVLIPFNSKYVEDADEVDEENRVYKQNPKYTTPEWRAEFAPIYFNILKNELLGNGVSLSVETPATLKKLTKAYLSRGIQLLDFINDEFDELDVKEKLEQKKTGDGVISLLAFIDIFKCTSYYDLLSRDEKLKSKKSIEELMETNAFLKKHYAERFQLKGRVDIRKAIVGLKRKQKDCEADEVELHS